MENKILAYMIPQGVASQMLRAAAGKKPGVITHIGLGTFVDPRIEGCKANQLTEDSGEEVVELVNIGGEERLFFKTIPLDICLIKGTYADEMGNVSCEEEGIIPDILEMVDNAVIDDKTKPQMAFRPAVELSYLTKEQQNDLLLTMQSEDRTPSLSQALLMKELSGKGELEMDRIFNIMRQEKPNQVEQFKIPKEKINRFFTPGTPAQKIEDTIIKALELYRKRERSRDMER